MARARSHPRPKAAPPAPLPRGLRTWFVVHFVADLVTALPLFFFPRQVLQSLGWGAVDPLATRLVAAALFGIGIQSLLGRAEGPEAYRGMLNLKLIWSSSASVGLALSLAEGAPPAAWAFLAIFVGFFFVWLRYRMALRQS